MMFTTNCPPLTTFLTHEEYRQGREKNACTLDQQAYQTRQIHFALVPGRYSTYKITKPPLQKIDKNTKRAAQPYLLLSDQVGS